jgi:hypothetical protein
MRPTRPDGRGQTPDGWTPHGMDSRRLDAGRVDSRRPTAGRSGRRPQVTGHRTAGQPDPGRRNRTGGHRVLDTGDRRPWLACWQGRSRRPRPTSRSRLDAPPGRRRLGEQQPGPLSSTDADGTQAATDGSGPAATVSCRWYAAVQLAPWRTALLGKRLGSRVARDGDWHPLWRVRLPVDVGRLSGGAAGRGMGCGVGGVERDSVQVNGIFEQGPPCIGSGASPVTGLGSPPQTGLRWPLSNSALLRPLRSRATC